uniref:Uncharacterized protein n=1 Tax=Anopheles maculatus TaxID=74869 RepID=A0A182SJM9_9DIPT
MVAACETEDDDASSTSISESSITMGMLLMSNLSFSIDSSLVSSLSAVLINLLSLLFSGMAGGSCLVDTTTTTGSSGLDVTTVDGTDCCCRFTSIGSTAAISSVIAEDVTDGFCGSSCFFALPSVPVVTALLSSAAGTLLAVVFSSPLNDLLDPRVARFSINCFALIGRSAVGAGAVADCALPLHSSLEPVVDELLAVLPSRDGTAYFSCTIDTSSL